MPDSGLDLRIDTRRGSFHLQLNCTLRAEWTVIFGPSGAGKSTLLRLIAGLDFANAAHIAHNSKPLTDTTTGLHLNPGRRRVGMVAQHPALFPHLSVQRNIGYGLTGPAYRAHQAASIDRIQEMLSLVGAEHLADRMPRDLSGGEAQRVALARALAPMPNLLLLDEPFSALDGAASDALLDRLRTWTRDNRVQTLMATHDAADALAIVAEVMLLREGRLFALGPAAEVLAAERERLLARL